jgi:hypothetical protein
MGAPILNCVRLAIAAQEDYAISADDEHSRLLAHLS